MFTYFIQQTSNINCAILLYAQLHIFQCEVDNFAAKKASKQTEV